MVFLVVPVRVDNGHKHPQKFTLVVFIQLAEDRLKVFRREGMKELKHRRLLLLVDPLLLEGRKHKLIELAHQSEAGTFVEEVKFLVVLVVHQRGVVKLRRGSWLR